MQPPRPDIFNIFINLHRHVGNLVNRFRLKLQIQILGFEQSDILINQISFRLSQNPHKIIMGQSFQLNPNRQPALQFRQQIGRFGQMKRTGTNKQNMIGFDHAVFGTDRCPLDQWQAIALYEQPLW